MNPSVWAAGGAVITSPSRDQLRTTVRGSVVVTNGTTGNVTAATTLSFDSTSGFANISNSLASFGSVYRHFRVRGLVIRAFGTTSLTGGGFVAAAYDAAPNALTFSSLQAVTNHVYSGVSPIGEVCEIRVPYSALPQEYRQVSTTAGGASEVNSCGTVQLYGVNAAATGTSSLMYEVLIDIEFKGFD